MRTPRPMGGAVAEPKRQGGQPGNGNAVQHGVYARTGTGLQRRDKRVRRLVAKVLAAIPAFEPSDIPVLKAWAELEILAASAFLSLSDRDEAGRARITDADGKPRELLTVYRQIRQTQLPFARELGLTPAARRALGLSDRRELTLEAYVAERYPPQDATADAPEGLSAPAGEVAPDDECGGAEGDA